METEVNNDVNASKTQIYPIAQRPTKIEEGGDGWSVDIILVSDETVRRGYYDCRGSITGGKFFYYKDSMIEDCATLVSLGEFPTHWYYA